VTQEPSRATHLAAPNILRTHKFISAMAYAPTIISTDFISKCIEKNKLLDPEDFLLQDKANEKRFHISLAQSQKRARENRNKLFEGQTIYCVENIHGGFDTYKSIIEANGGRCNMYRGRPGTMVPSRRADGEDSTMDDSFQAEVILISGPDRDQARVWPRFRQMAEGSRKIPRIVRSEWLIESAMAQEILPIGSHELH
jgi:Regulator of Ty1 transposition protein 107 BRCT domain